MTDLSTLLSQLTCDVSQEEHHYVYYDKDTNKIEKITPVKDNSSTDDFFQISSEIVSPILLGTKKIDDYTVYYDFSLKCRYIKLIKLYHNFSQNLIEVFDETISADLEILVRQQNITFSITKDLHEHISSDDSPIICAIAEKNNPYKLYNSVIFPAKNLVDSDFCIDYQFTKDILENGVSIYTNKIFDTYSLKVDYE